MTTATAQRAPHQNFNIRTDLPSTADVVKIAKATFSPAAASVLDMIQKGKIALKDGEAVKINAASPTLEQAAWLYYLVETMKPILTFEMGYNQGVASAVITAAHMANVLNGGHVPMQTDAKFVENGIGNKLFADLGLIGFQVMDHEPALVLPQLFLEQLGAGLGLVYLNSAVQSDEQMMEYFYLNKLMLEGGVYVINTSNNARRFLVDYIKEHRRDYAVKELDCGLTLVQKPHESAVINEMFSA